jgi:hypothetical protein
LINPAAKRLPITFHYSLITFSSLRLNLCAFASLADVAKGGDGRSLLCLRFFFIACRAVVPQPREKADQFAVLFPRRNAANRADAPNTIKVTIKTAPVTICCSSGVTPATDLLVCADGINSTARKLMAPTASPEYAGYIAWRGTAGQENVTQNTFDAMQNSITYFVMPNGHLLTYPILARDRSTGEGKRLINWL